MSSPKDTPFALPAGHRDGAAIALGPYQLLTVPVSSRESPQVRRGGAPVSGTGAAGTRFPPVASKRVIAAADDARYYTPAPPMRLNQS